MAENLFPSGFGDIILTEDEVNAEDMTRTGYKKSANFSFEKGDFLRNGSNKIMECTPFDAWVQWCQKCVITPRFQCDAYSTDIGIDLRDVIGSSSKSEAEAILTSEISEALAADPYGRTDYVQSVEYNWISEDTVEATITVLGIEQTSATITAMIGQ